MGDCRDDQAAEYAAGLKDDPVALLNQYVFEAVEDNDSSNIRQYIKFGGSLGFSDNSHRAGATPIIRCVQRRHHALLELLVELAQADDINAVDQFGKAALHHAAQSNDAVAVKVLCTHRSILFNLQDGGSGNTPLHLAAFNGQFAATECLVEHGATVSSTNKLGETPLHLAAKQDRVECVRFLIGKGADIHARTFDFGQEAMQYACQSGATDTAFLLQQRGVNVHAPEARTRRSAIDTARTFGHHMLAQELLERERDTREAAQRERVRRVEREWAEEQWKIKTADQRAAAEARARRKAADEAWLKRQEARRIREERMHAEKAEQSRAAAKARIAKITAEKRRKKKRLLGDLASAGARLVQSGSVTGSNGSDTPLGGSSAALSTGRGDPAKSRHSARSLC